MRATINGRRYDTDKAELVGMATSDLDHEHPRWWSEKLYRSPRGMWFLVGQGGGFSRWKLDPQIKPLSDAEAQLWLKEQGT